MSTRRLAITANFFLTPAVLALSFGLQGFWIGALAALGLGLGGWIGWREEMEFWNPDIYFTAAILLTAFGAFLGLMSILLVIAVAAALAGWDLLRFLERIKQSDSFEKIDAFEKPHLAQLGFTLLGGSVTASIVLSAQVQISFTVALVLAGVLIISVGQLIRLLRN